MSLSHKARAGIVLSAFMSAALASPSFARTPEIPQSLIDRYGHDDRSNTGVSAKASNCSTIENLARGRVMQKHFNGGHGRTTLSLDKSGGGTVNFGIELSTSSQGLPQQSCDLFWSQ